MRRIVPLLLLLPMLSACISTDKPLSVRKDSDDRILGHWHSDDEPNKPMEIDVTQAEKGWYKLVQTEYSQDGQKKVQTYPVALTRTKNANYASVEVQEARPGIANATSPSDCEPRYTIFRYAFKDKTMTAQNLNYTKLEEEVKAKRLKGQAWATTWGTNAKISEPSASFLRKIDGPHGDEYFDRMMIFER